MIAVVWLEQTALEHSWGPFSIGRYASAGPDGNRLYIARYASGLPTGASLILVRLFAMGVTPAKWKENSRENNETDKKPRQRLVYFWLTQLISYV